MTSLALPPTSIHSGPDSPDAATRDSTPLVTEHITTIRLPLIPLGDMSLVGAATRVVDIGIAPPPGFHFFRDVEGALRWRLVAADWQLTSPALNTGRAVSHASAEAVVDVYVGLLTEFAIAGLPLDNTVRFTQASLMRRLGWAAGSARRAPSGGGYNQLELALEYLRYANIESDAVRAQLEAIYGLRFLRADFSILQSWTKSALDGCVGNAYRMEARFSDHFASLLRHEAGAVRYSAATYEALPRGISRALYRYICGLRATVGEPVTTVPGLTILGSLGSRRQQLAPSRMRAILDEPHHLLVAHGVLGDEPKWSESETGVEQVTYMLERAPDLTLLLEESALAFGVTAASARSWATDKPDVLAQVLAAAIQGILTPTASVARMVQNYIANPRLIDAGALPHFDPARGLLPKQRCPEFEYLREEYTEATAWLARRPDVRGPLRRQYASPGRPDWVADGLVLLAARRMRNAQTISAWRKRAHRKSR